MNINNDRAPLSVWVRLYICLCVCVWMCVSSKNTAVCCLTARKSPRNSSLPLGLAIYILRKMPRKPDESSVECYGHGFLIAARPPRGIEHYGNWVCRPTTSLRERWRKTMQIGSPMQWETRVRLRNREPFNTSTVKANNLLSFTEWQSSMQSHSIDLPIATDHHAPLFTTQHTIHRAIFVGVAYPPT